MSYFQDLSEGEKARLEHEFVCVDTADDRRVEILGYLRDAANEAKMGRPCPRCKNYPFYAPYSEALIEGHVYSPEGAREVHITGYCEFCFDLVTMDQDD